MKAGRAILAIVAVSGIAARIYFWGAPHAASCPELGRPLTDQELIEAVASDKAVGDFLAFFSGVERPPVDVDRFDTVAEFLAAYPSCCEALRLGKVGYSTTDFWRWLRREAWPVVGIAYPKPVFEEGGTVSEQITREYFEVEPCGAIVPLV